MGGGNLGEIGERCQWKVGKEREVEVGSMRNGQKQCNVPKVLGNGRKLGQN